MKPISTMIAGAFVALAGLLQAQAPTAADGIARVPVRVIQGRLVTACQIAAVKRIVVNLFIDYDAPNGLLLHNKAAAGIESEQPDGTPNKITVHLPDVSIEVPQREHGDEAYFNHFTKWYSKELGENAVVGTLGARVLAKYHVTFDLAAGFMELSAPKPQSSEPAEEVPGTTSVPLTIYNGLAWVPVAFGDKRAGAMALATSKYDTWIDSELCEETGHAAGDVGSVRMAGIELAKYVPFRPETLRHKHPDGVFGMTGLNLLERFRVEIDRTNLVSRWTPTSAPSLAAEDLEFYKARATEKAEAVEAWLQAHGSARLVPEAAALLLDQRLEQSAPEEPMRNAMQWVFGSYPKDLKATGSLELLQKMLQTGRPAYAIRAGELGLGNGREDRYPESVHKLRRNLGSILLEQGDTKAAWKHLLSAALGLPEDGPLNLDLARCYEKEERWSRAFSRYLVALLSPDSGAAALAGLERVQPKLEDQEAFSVPAIERLVEGRIEGFGVATKYKPEGGEAPTRTAIVEYFSNAHAEGEQCVALARDGLRDHFGPERCVLIRYALPTPELEPMVNELSVHMGKAWGTGRIVQRLDGVANLPGLVGKTRFKQEVFDHCKAAIVRRLEQPSEHEIGGSAEGSAEGIRGSVQFRGPQEDGLVAQVLLVEKGVLFSGRSLVVIHRNVARCALTEKVEGAAYAPVADWGQEKRPTFTVRFDRKWPAIVAANNAYLDQLVKNGASEVSRLATRIDWQQTAVVAILRRRATGEVVQAAQIDPGFPLEWK